MMSINGRELRATPQLTVRCDKVGSIYSAYTKEGELLYGDTEPDDMFNAALAELDEADREGGAIGFGSGVFDFTSNNITIPTGLRNRQVDLLGSGRPGLPEHPYNRTSGGTLLDFSDGGRFLTPVDANYYNVNLYNLGLRFSGTYNAYAMGFDRSRVNMYRCGFYIRGTFNAIPVAMGSYGVGGADGVPNVFEDVMWVDERQAGTSTALAYLYFEGVELRNNYYHVKFNNILDGVPSMFKIYSVGSVLLDNFTAFLESAFDIAGTQLANQFIFDLGSRVTLRGVQLLEAAKIATAHINCGAGTLTVNGNDAYLKEGGYATSVYPTTGGAGAVKYLGMRGKGWENSGTDTIPSGGPPASKVVAHGLPYTPTLDQIIITLGENPTNTPGAIWVDTIGAANFTVNCENDPGASNLDFGWRIIP